jgi:hypothetical protein
MSVSPAVAAQSPEFQRVAIAALDGHPASGTLKDKFRTETGVGYLMNGQVPRLKALTDIVVEGDTIRATVEVAEYSLFNKNFSGASVKYPVELKGPSFAGVRAALAAAQADAPVVFE